jgi:hypothetical protein
MTKEFNEAWYVATVKAPVQDRVSKHTYQGWRPCMEWCVATFGGGIGSTAWGPGWRYVGEGVFEFRSEQDHIMFMLRWS